MENNPFDSLFSSSQLQMLKVLFPLFPPESRAILAIWIRFFELKQTLDYIHQCPGGRITDISAFPQKDSLLSAIMPYCNDKQKNELEKYRQAMEQAKQMQDLMEIAKDMKDVFPGTMNMSGMDPLQFFQNFNDLKASDNPSFPSPVKEQADTMSTKDSFPKLKNSGGDEEHGTMDDG